MKELSSIPLKKAIMPNFFRNFVPWLLSYQEIYRKKRESVKGKRNNKHTAEKRCGQTIRETDYFSTFSLTACLTRKCKDKLE